MKRVNAAYAVLSNGARRQTYDRHRFGMTVPSPPPRPTPPRPRARAAYPPETENDWFHLHVYVAGRTVPEIEAAAEAQMQACMAEFNRLVAPPGAGNAVLVDLLNSATTGQYAAYTPYGRLVARITLRTLLPLLREYAVAETPEVERLRQLIAQVNDLVQDRMGTEGLKMVLKGKNIVADWAGLLLTIVNLLWGDG